MEICLREAEGCLPYGAGFTGGYGILPYDAAGASSRCGSVTLAF